jgi:hypothetical protein
MPTDVSGTINIIAEVMGAGSQNPGAAGQVMPAANAADGNKKWGWMKGVGDNLKTIAKIVGIAGILTQSKILSQTFSAMGRIFGALVDVILAPLMPLFIRGLNVLAKVVGFVQAFMNNPIQALKDAWFGLVDWFKTTWEEKGGFWGVLKEGVLNITGAVLVATLFGTVTGLFSPMWVAGKIFGLGVLITKGTLRAALGLARFGIELATSPRTAARSLFKWAILTPAQFFKRLFLKAYLLTKTYVRKALGLGVQLAATPIGRGAWWTLMFASKPVVWTARTIASFFGITFAFAGIAAFLVAVGLIIGTLTAGAALFLLFEWILNKGPGAEEREKFNVPLIEEIIERPEDLGDVGESGLSGVTRSKTNWFGIPGS